MPTSAARPATSQFFRVFRGPPTGFLGAVCCVMLALASLRADPLSKKTDLDFFRELSRRFGAPGDFAQAYVIAHEVGHHVQNLMGTIKAGGSRGAEGQSVRTELQADCFAGIWALSAKGEGILDAGDINEAMTAAAAVGDDTLQKRSQGYSVPETFTHGTADQRKRWFNKGFQSGNTSACDTFSANQL